MVRIVEFQRGQSLLVLGHFKYSKVSPKGVWNREPPPTKVESLDRATWLYLTHVTFNLYETVLVPSMSVFKYLQQQNVPND
ncbi:hypothetical protein QTP88_026070 [Uroleucon formosanum]